jgi:hypothetical protein
VAIILGAHLIPDSFEHGVPFFYPFVDTEISLDILLLGDPWFLFPLIIAFFWMFIKPTQRKLIYVPIMVSIMYLILRTIGQQISIYEIKRQFVLTPETVIKVVPLAENLIRPGLPFDWMQWKYSVYSEQRIIIGKSTLLGKLDSPLMNAIYASKGSLIKTDSLTYRKTEKDEPAYNVLWEREFHEKLYILAEHKGEERLFILKDNTWYVPEDINQNNQKDIIQTMSFILKEK